MPNRRPKATSKRKLVVIYPPGLDQVLIEEADRFMAKRGEPFPIPLRRRIRFLAGLVQDPKSLLAPNDPDALGDQCIFAKAYARNPEPFLDLMLHLTRYYTHMGPIVRALRENWVITFRDCGIEYKKPINQATNDELAVFIRTVYRVKVVEPKTIARCRERLAAADSKRSPADLITLEALRLFSEHIASKMIKEK